MFMFCVSLKEHSSHNSSANSAPIQVRDLNGKLKQNIIIEGSITDLAWDSANQLLYSASTDSLIIVWDIGGRRGNCYELKFKFEKYLIKFNIFSGHNSKLTKLGLGRQTPRRLFSADESGRLMCWDMETKRITAPAWRDSDKCEICDQPFFWNLKDMWDRKVFY
jgi:WD40 repeat protein